MGRRQRCRHDTQRERSARRRWPMQRTCIFLSYAVLMLAGCASSPGEPNGARPRTAVDEPRSVPPVRSSGTTSAVDPLTKKAQAVLKTSLVAQDEFARLRASGTPTPDQCRAFRAKPAPACSPANDARCALPARRDPPTSVPRPVSHAEATRLEHKGAARRVWLHSGCPVE